MSQKYMSPQPVNVLVTFHQGNIIHFTADIQHRKFFQMSYICYGSGQASRNAQFIAHQCVHILYAFRLVYLYHCIHVLRPDQILQPQILSKKYLNSTVDSAFTAIQNIKRPAKSCFAMHVRQNVTWVGSGYVSLLVHHGKDGLERAAVSHMVLKTTYHKILDNMKNLFIQMGIKMIKYAQFKTIKDSSVSTSAGEGMSFFNQVWTKPTTQQYVIGKDRDFRLTFLETSYMLCRLALTAIHLSGGPSPRGTEQAVTRLLNSNTELMRNVQFLSETIGVENGCVGICCVYVTSIYVTCVDMRSACHNGISTRVGCKAFIECLCHKSICHILYMSQCYMSHILNALTGSVTVVHNSK